MTEFERAGQCSGGEPVVDAVARLTVGMGNEFMGVQHVLLYILDEARPGSGELIRDVDAQCRAVGRSIADLRAVLVAQLAPGRVSRVPARPVHTPTVKRVFDAMVEMGRPAPEPESRVKLVSMRSLLVRFVSDGSWGMAELLAEFGLTAAALARP